MKRFPNLKEAVDPERLHAEYRDLCLSDLNFNVKNTTEFWSAGFDLKNSAEEALYQNLSAVIKLLLILPYSNADVERVFSDLNNLKTDKRKKLKTRTVKALLRTKDSICYVIKFKPSKKIINRYYQHKAEMAIKQKFKMEQKLNRMKKKE